MIPDLSIDGGESLSMDEWDAAAIADIAETMEYLPGQSLAPVDSAWREYGAHPDAGYIRFVWENPAAWQILAGDVDQAEFMSTIDELMDYSGDSSMLPTRADAVFNRGTGEFLYVAVVNASKHEIVCPDDTPELQAASYDRFLAQQREQAAQAFTSPTVDQIMRVFYSNTRYPHTTKRFDNFEDALAYAEELAASRPSEPDVTTNKRG